MVNGCLGQLLQLELLASGSGSNNIDLGNGIDNSNLLNSSSSASNVTVDSSANVTAVVDANATANATADASAIATATSDAKAEKKDKKNGKRGGAVKRSSGEKLRVLTGLGLGLVFGAAVLSL